MGYMIDQPNRKVADLLHRCAIAEANGTTAYRGMTYEQGILAGLRWVFDSDEPYPLDDDDTDSGGWDNEAGEAEDADSTDGVAG